MKKTQFRHEMKYFIGDSQCELLSRRLRMTMDLDPYADDNREYMIRSLYFDNVFDSALLEKMAGTERRKKYRIRIYNMNSDVIKLECKEKVGPYIHKRSLRISESACNSLLYSSNAESILQYDHPLAKEFHSLIISEALKPAVIVDYIREAYVAPYQDVRITFDKDLHSGFHGIDLFDPELPTVPCLFDGETILEVKFNNYLPEYFHYLIQGEASVRSAASKYVICRQFE